MDVVEADAVQRLQHVADARHRLEEVQRLFDRHVEHVGDRLALEGDLERLAVVALALADVAGDVDVGQEVHLDLDRSEEHTSELQSPYVISYAVFCLKKQK